MTFNELAIAVPTALLVLVLAVMILDHHLSEVLKKDRASRQSKLHDHEGEAVTLEAIRMVIREELHAAGTPPPPDP